MSDALDTARKLVALATDPSAAPEEARTAAMQAARLIREHKLLDAPVANPFTNATPPPRGSYSNYPGPIDFDELLRRANERVRRNREAQEHEARERSAAFDPTWNPFATADERERQAYGEGWERIWGTK